MVVPQSAQDRAFSGGGIGWILVVCLGGCRL